MSDASYIVQEVRWYQFRAPDGRAFMVMLSSLPNGFWTAVPCEVAIRHGDHSLMALAGTPEDAIAQLQQTLAGKTPDDVFPAGTE
jgi:hypothetical protein